jgi:aspartokinase-like uncharacterized kinase
VLKVGGGLSAVAGALDQVCSRLAQLSRHHRLLIVPGGGPFADAVRRFQTEQELSGDAAHWTAILAMDQYAHVLADRIEGATLVEEPGEIRGVLEGGKLPVLAPSRWMRSADVLPHSWEATSDSIAAFVAGALDADRLVLIKPAWSDAPVDSYFDTALPAGLPCLILPWDRLDELPTWLSGPIAAAAPRE